jgi:methionine synthase II (cobalamin-independent)
MFATLIGPYPQGDGPLATVAELAAAGLEPVSDGRGARLAVGSAAPAAAAAVVSDWQAAAASTSTAVKQALLGPYSAARRVGADPTATAEELATLVVALAAAGCPLVEIEEPDAVAAATDGAMGADLALALRRLTDGVAGRVHLSLTITGGNVERLGAARLFDLPFDSYAFDLIAGPDNWRLIAQAPGDRGIVCGALDPAASSDDRPEPLVWAAHYAASTGGRGLARVGLANASSLAGLGRERANDKLRALAEAARLAALQDPKELAALLDPRAVDSRSAALGRYRPPDRD